MSILKKLLELFKGNREMKEKAYLVELPQLGGKYSLYVTPIDNGKNYWNSLKVEILDSKTETILGSYVRNYSSLYDTFYPFEQDGKHYALYSKDYTATRVMSLPDCKDVCGEDRTSFGFCPTGYYVPALEDDPDEYDDEELERLVLGKMGFICGCVWGDDRAWKIQFLDLSLIREGKLVRDDRFGYIELPDNMKLKDTIRFRYFNEKHPRVYITTAFKFPLDKETDLFFPGIIDDYHDEQEKEAND